MVDHPNRITDTLVFDGVGKGTTPAPHVIETDRLQLYRSHLDTVDVDRIHRLFGDIDDPDAVFDLCGWNHHDRREESVEYLDERTADWDAKTNYEYVLEEQGTESFIGTAVLEVGDDGSGELALWLRPTAWGNGYAGGQADALVAVGFECVDVEYVVAGCLPENEASRRAIEKFVHRYNGTYYGSPPITRSTGSETAPVEYRPEWVITHEQYGSTDTGIGSSIPGISYENIATE